MRTTEIEPARAPRARSWRSRTMLAVRRTHLVLGLVLLPFVALYGATAVLFNHASWFTDVEERALDARTLEGSALFALTADPAATARALAPASIEPFDARWEGAWSFESRGDGRTARAEIDARARGGRVRAWPTEDDPATSLPTRREAQSVPGWSDPTVLAASIAPAAGLDTAGLDPVSLAMKRAPRLAFRFVEDGRPLLARWDPANGALRVVADEDREPIDFLQRLHVAHGSPGFVDARWWWSLLVDLMGFAMLAWAASGVVLWWSIRAVRRLGYVALVVAAVLAIALAAGMHGALPR